MPKGRAGVHEITAAPTTPWKRLAYLVIDIWKKVIGVLPAASAVYRGDYCLNVE